jgi:hypothetical protein
MFQSRSEHYATNVKHAPTVHATLATLTGPDGAQQPAVAIFKARQIQSVLPTADALRLATEIADALAAHRAPKKEN